jgi:DNA mismatch repair protein MutH
MQLPHNPPSDIDELMSRAYQLAGLTLGDLAHMADLQVPENLRRYKGWGGQLIERWLGATAGSKPEQDFPDLGVELKTLPIDTQGNPLETTYVCYTPLLGQERITWEKSNVCNKLQCVLWIPIDGQRDVAPQNRRVGSPILWRPNSEEITQLKRDWEELMERISLGEIESITAREGEVLQLRPKAADGTKLTDAIGRNGQIIKTRPRGFYLRKSFTQNIISQAYAVG